ncbi:MAG: hypothetical protein A2821_03615 [Candidatus Magasanikbacteria bacterium RIFCSPHIGHO2_01_FULL_41_23]|uniref:Uncharacterized protein n=1 Tax=Candidatus Magasanikbacteria bacterium RIFCSPLOWO2_01_FULL_40_15 TaxID=1798686 RepID=A0A1F6N1R5_9BACT|nr:MAG: hypothetical protein A2821_03615 [Candidatus Magasanikbacteria bacterium RIFCSPHIGHO2_01_FULL_41_23]OGH67245.1 MAG: hypothetical protein A3C66_00690 [Candidatus Magasanikbacteria bacterium RIFCSPHIGHO2_02_FULL_41_35]OGH76648.1 MAG: hypothetical protein A3F22_03690 [Candidatus Magasanikbacteria bacterium RIFCSPHIGHO2_12_FULL_41_16]OGH77812.1 MAG: hypothetical protein A2983_00240 [Candidatus Magasanikbacteria bacterium RIFCSPLOWO2_01_FULL_40_15]
MPQSLDKLGTSLETNSGVNIELNKTVFTRLDELEILVRQNIQWNELVYQEAKRTRRRLTLMVVGDWLRLFLWLTPLILGAIFLPPLFRKAEQLYTDTIVRPQQKIEGEYNRALDSIRHLNNIVSSTIPKF